MALYMIGDVQGCDAALQRLLDTVNFSPSRDTLYLLGDLVNRGPDSAGVLRRLMGYGDAARCLLGNHDLHLLALASGVRKLPGNDTLSCVLNAPDRESLIRWLHNQNMAMMLPCQKKPMLLVHAGVLPSWSADQTMAFAQEVEHMLRGKNSAEFFAAMYENSPCAWDDSLVGVDRLRVIVNALTRIRFCSAKGEMEFATKEGATRAPPGYMPWFDVPDRQTTNVTVAFGHWSTLGWLGRSDAISLDTGCVWGGALSALRFSLQDEAQELIQVQCKAEQQPGS